jgi:hypothetical protein
MTFLDVVVAMLVVGAVVVWSLEYLLPTKTDAHVARARRIKVGVSRTFTFFFFGAVIGAMFETIFVQSSSVLRPEVLWVITGVGVIAIGAVVMQSLLGLVPPDRKKSRTALVAISILALFAACIAILLGSPTLVRSFDADTPMYAACGLAVLAAAQLLLGERGGGTSSD